MGNLRLLKLVSIGFLGRVVFLNAEKKSHALFVTNEILIFINLHLIFCSMTDIESIEQKS